MSEKLCSDCNAIMQDLMEGWICSFCGNIIYNDKEDLDPYAGCDMTPDPDGKTTGDVDDR